MDTSWFGGAVILYFDKGDFRQWDGRCGCGRTACHFKLIRKVQSESEVYVEFDTTIHECSIQELRDLVFDLKNVTDSAALPH